MKLVEDYMELLGGFSAAFSIFPEKEIDNVLKSNQPDNLH
jgi:hypothetical protein